jgi:hypothetical protein
MYKKTHFLKNNMFERLSFYNKKQKLPRKNHYFIKKLQNKQNFIFEILICIYIIFVIKIQNIL